MDLENQKRVFNISEEHGPCLLYTSTKAFLGIYEPYVKEHTVKLKKLPGDVRCV